MIDGGGRGRREESEVSGRYEDKKERVRGDGSHKQYGHGKIEWWERGGEKWEKKRMGGRSWGRREGERG